MAALRGRKKNRSLTGALKNVLQPELQLTHCRSSGSHFAEIHPIGDGARRLPVGVVWKVEGLEPEVVAACDVVLEIPMFGQKESYNVVQAAAMALYQVTFRGTDQSAT